MSQKLELFTEHNYHFNPASVVTCKITVVGELKKDKFLASLKELKRIHPFLSCTITQDETGKLYYDYTNKDCNLQTEFIPKEEEDAWIQKVEDLMKTPFNLRTCTPIKFVLLYDVDHFDIVLFGHHIIGDGLSYTYLLNDLLEIYCGNNKSLPIRTPRIIQSMNDFPGKRGIPADQVKVITRLKETWETNRKHYPFEAYEALYNGYHQHAESSLIVGTIEKETFQPFIHQCKQNGVKINTALLMAFLYGMDTEQQQVSIAVNNRPLFPFVPKRSMGNYSSMITHDLCYDKSRSFWENAKIADIAIASILKNPEKRLHLLKLFATFNSSAFDAIFFNGDGILDLQDLKALSGFMMPNTSLDTFNTSNLGAVPIRTVYEDYQIKDFAFLTSPATAYNRNIGIATMDNACTISILYKIQSVEAEEIQQLLNNTIDFLSTLTSKEEALC